MAADPDQATRHTMTINIANNMEAILETLVNLKLDGVILYLAQDNQD